MRWIGVLCGILTIVSAYIIPTIDVACNSSAILPTTNVIYPNDSSITPYGNNTLFTPISCYDRQIGIIGTPNLTVTTYVSCPTSFTYDMGWGAKNIVPQPSFSMEGLSLSTVYARENMSYVVDMVSTFDSNVRSNIPGVYYSTPTATYPDSLYTGAYNMSNSYWHLAPINCSQISISSNMTLSQMFNCYSQTSGYCMTTTSENGTPFIDIGGAVYMELRQSNTSITMWTYPIQYRYNSYSTVISSTSTSSIVTFTSFSRLIGNVLRLTITSKMSSGYLTSPTYNNSLTLISYTPLSQVQVWEFNSTSSTYIGVYAFRWIAQPSNVVVAVTVSVSLTPQTPISQTYTLGTSIHTYSDSNFSIPTYGPYDSSSPIYIASTYDGSDDIYRLSLYNMYICYAVLPSIVPSYDPSNGMYGCSRPSPSIPSSNIITLVSNGSVVSDSRYTVSMSSVIIGGRQAIGVSIQFASAIDDGVYYIQADTILSPTHRRMRQVVSPDLGRAMSAIFIYRDYLYNQDKTSNVLLPLLSVLVLLLIIVVPIIYIGRKIYIYSRKRRMLNSIVQKSKTYLKASSPHSIETIDDVLNDPILLGLFKQQCITTHNEDSLMFILSVSNYRRLNSSKDRENEYKRIYDLYIRKNARYELNITDDLRLPDQNNLDEIVKHVKFYLSTNHLSSFKLSLKRHNSSV